MSNQGHYVLGMEPSNSPNVFGRAAAREAGELSFLNPGETASYRLEFRLRRAADGQARRDTAAAASAQSASTKPAGGASA